MQNIPAYGPYAVTFNHYYRPGFSIWWLCMAIAAALPVEPRVITTSELTFPGSWYAPIGMPVSRFVLKRLARVYGFSAMPPMPPREKDVLERAACVRAVLSYVNENLDAVLVLAPEGGDQPGGRLNWPPPGLGRFAALLASKGLSILPVAGWEQDGSLYVSFGQAYRLELGSLPAVVEKDRAVSAIVMRAIADLLPEALRGDFA